jgi:shikimate kinase
MNLIFCGLSKSGKTTIGKRVAERLQWTFIDTDQLIGENSREIYYNQGELFFRALEKKSIASLHNCQQCVIATGGGSLLDPDNQKFLKTLGISIYLKVDPNVAKARGMSPHLATEETVQKRIPIYENSADLTIETEGLSEEEIVEQVVWRVTPLGIFSK